MAGLVESDLDLGRCYERCEVVHPISQGKADISLDEVSQVIPDGYRVKLAASGMHLEQEVFDAWWHVPH